MIPNSVPLTSVYIPDMVGIKHLSSSSLSIGSTKLIYDTDYYFTTDIDGKLANIVLTKIPFINFRHYNIDYKTWYYLDLYGNRWKKDGDTYISVDNIELVTDVNGTEIDAIIIDKNAVDGAKIKLNSFSYNIINSLKKYSPITVSVNGNLLSDITDYTGNLQILPDLNQSDEVSFKEFYFDKASIIYTNQELSQFRIEDIIISYDYIDPSIRVKATLNTNSFGIVDYTPTVDYYIVNMIGQDLI